MGKPVLGYRTEARSPYGTLTDYTKGMHFFKFFPLDAFLAVPSASIPNSKELDSYCGKLAHSIDEMIKQAEINYKKKFPNPQIS